MTRSMFNRDFYLSGIRDSITSEREWPELKAVAYLYTSGKGDPAVLAFSGRRNKPDLHYRYRTDQAREDIITEWLNGLRSTQTWRNERRPERNKPHTLKVGDVLSTNWGYEQTNIEFFEVTKVVSPYTVEVREVAQNRTETGWLRGTCKPRLGQYIGETLKRRSNANNSVRIDEVRTASPTSAERDHYWSAYA